MAVARPSFGPFEQQLSFFTSIRRVCYIDNLIIVQIFGVCGISRPEITDAKPTARMHESGSYASG